MTPAFRAPRLLLGSCLLLVLSFPSAAALPDPPGWNIDQEDEPITEWIGEVRAEVCAAIVDLTTVYQVIGPYVITSTGSHPCIRLVRVDRCETTH